MTPDLKEKRKHQRINRKFVLKVAAEGDSPVTRDWTLVTTKNMSAGGVMFTYDRTLREGTPLDFTIFFPDHSVKCKGQVNRIVSAEAQPLVNVAASIEGLLEKDLEFLTRNAV